MWKKKVENRIFIDFNSWFARGYLYAVISTATFAVVVIIIIVVVVVVVNNDNDNVVTENSFH